ncbi:T9SS type B sorting domain-containing protein [Neolewinella xylanilytica]|uniref:T9SS type B sorting domain-containing protein n=1 Tax=Neolewinella xylanilytica TaxID=1514080 RepID=UPI000CEA9615|nr:gliding motility-associated C-terminal domain-containing protein [Neolewinella xylanilytica]
MLLSRYLPHLICLPLALLSFWGSTEAQNCDGSTGPVIFAEDFGSGAGPGEPLAPGTTTYTYGSVGGGNYSVTNTTGINRDRWHDAPDHTEGDVNGYALVFDASDDPGIFYRATFDSLCENTDYTFSCYVANVVRPFACEGNSIEPNLKFSLFDPATGNSLGSVITGSIPTTDTLTWNQFSISFRTRPGQRDVDIEITNNAIGGCGNDLAIDDFRFSRCNPVREQRFDLCQLPEQMVVVGADTLRTPGVYESFIDLPNTCNDSTIITTLYGEASSNTVEVIASCIGDVVTVDGVDYTSDTVFIDTIAHAGGCVSTVTYNLTFSETVTTELQATICQGDSLLFAGSWIKEEGVYRDTLTSVNGCDSSVVYTVRAVDFSVDIVGLPTMPVEVGDTLALGVITSSTGTVAYTWTPPQVFDCPTCQEVLLSILRTTTIGLSAIDEVSGCVDSVFFTLETEPCGGSYFPNAFSPNGDGANDIYHPFLSDCTTEVVAFEIFDRWGAKVHSQSGVTADQVVWDGQWNRHAAPIGVYSYFVSYVLSNGGTRLDKGHVTLLR